MKTQISEFTENLAQAVKTENLDSNMYTNHRTGCRNWEQKLKSYISKCTENRALAVTTENLDFKMYRNRCTGCRT